MLRLLDVPKLESPVLVLMLTGWVDSGFAGVGAASHLIAAFDEPADLGRFDLAEECDLQQHRPIVRVRGGEVGGVTYPSVRLVAGTLGRDLVVVHGPEPSLHWRSFVAEVVDFAVRIEVESAYCLGGMPAAVTHRRPPVVLTTVNDSQLVARAHPSREDYSGPTGAQSVLQVELGSHDIGAYGLWAQIPPYLTALPSPPAIAALLGRLRELSGVEADTSALDRQAVEYARRVEEQLVQRPDLAELVDRLDAATPPAEGVLPDLPAAADVDALMADLQAWLARQDDDD